MKFRERTMLIGVALLSWTFPRFGFLKITELLALLNLPYALASKKTLRISTICFAPFLILTIIAALVGVSSLGSGDNSLSSNKLFYSSPELTIFFTFFRTLIFILFVTSLLHFFRTSSNFILSRSLNWIYILTLLPGLLQVVRIYSGFYFDIPFFERAEVGPFSGIFDAGYLRIMGFDFEPLSYATSISVACCLRFYARGRIPLLGLVLLGHTLSLGAIVAFTASLFFAYHYRFRIMLVPIYLFFLIVSSIFLWINLDEILRFFLLSLSVSERLNAWASCINMWLDNPLGVGLGLYSYFHNFYDRIGMVAPKLDHFPNNDPMMFLANGGVPYLVAYLWIFHYGLCSTKSRWIRVALMGLLVQSTSSFLIFNPAAAVVIALALSGRTLPPPLLTRWNFHMIRGSER